MLSESEAVIDERPKHLTEEVPSENPVHTAAQIDDELQQARETLERIGIPIEISAETGNSLFVVTSAQKKEFLEALSKFPESLQNFYCPILIFERPRESSREPGG